MKKIYVIHENDEWLIPLRESLKKINAPYEEWHMNKVKFDYKKTPPEGIFYNRMSASSHSRGHRYAPENTKNLLFWLEKENRYIKLRVSQQGLRLIDKHGLEKVLSDIKKTAKKLKG